MNTSASDQISSRCGEQQPVYRDLAQQAVELESISTSDDTAPPDRASFPVRLHYMLKEVERSGQSQAVGWAAHGRCFMIRERRAFINQILPRFFNQTKISSFSRQLALYGFRRLTQGVDKGGYYHEAFLKSSRQLARSIRRSKVNGNKTRKPAMPHLEPDLAAYPAAIKPPKRPQQQYFNATQQAGAPPAIQQIQNQPLLFCSTTITPLRSSLASTLGLEEQLRLQQTANLQRERSVSYPGVDLGPWSVPFAHRIPQPGSISDVGPASAVSDPRLDEIKSLRSAANYPMNPSLLRRASFMPATSAEVLQSLSSSPPIMSSNLQPTAFPRQLENILLGRQIPDSIQATQQLSNSMVARPSTTEHSWGSALQSRNGGS